MNTITITLPLPLAPNVAALVSGLLGCSVPHASSDPEPAAAPEPAADPEPVVEETAAKKRGRPKKAEVVEPEPAPALSRAELVAIVERVVGSVDVAKVKAVFAEHGAAKLSDIKPADYVTVAAKLEGLEAQA